jgi:threonine/homoserine/homoserine lactone efflux protein
MATSALAFTVMKFIGAAYLIFLGIKIWRDKSSFQVQNDALSVRKHPAKLFLEAFLVSVTNPKAILVITALFPQFMSKGGIDLLETTVLSFTYGVMCFANHAAIAFAGGHMRRFLTSEKRMRWVRRTTGGLFVGFGAALASASR